MRRLLLIFILGAAVLSCDSGGGGSDPAGSRTVTGTVTGGSNIVIGAFSSDYRFTADFSGEEDVVYREFYAGTSGSFTPLVNVTPAGDGTYSITLPADPEDMGELIAWSDSNTDGNFDLGTETGYLPRKSIEGTERTINGFGWIIIGSAKYYLVCYQDDEGSQNSGFDIVGTSGFNFTID